MGPIEQELNTIMASAYTLAATLDANQLTIMLGQMVKLPTRSAGNSPWRSLNLQLKDS